MLIPHSARLPFGFLATNDTVGDQTIYNKATTLASHSVEYAKGLVGSSSTSTTAKAEDKATSTTGGQTIGGLVGEGRDLAAAVLGAAETVVKGAAHDADKKVDTDKAQGYVASGIEQARGLAAQALHTAQGLVATAQKEVDEAAANNSTEDIKAKAQATLDSAKTKAADLQSVTAAKAGKLTRLRPQARVERWLIRLLSFRRRLRRCQGSGQHDRLKYDGYLTRFSCCSTLLFVYTSPPAFILAQSVCRVPERRVARGTSGKRFVH